VYKNQDTSVARAKKAVTDYRRAGGPSEGLAELLVFYCECAVGFSNEVGLQDRNYFDALVRLLQALKLIDTLPEERRSALVGRLHAVRGQRHTMDYGVGDDRGFLLVEQRSAAPEAARQDDGAATT